MIHENLYEIYHIGKTLYLSYKQGLQFNIMSAPLTIKPAMKHITVLIKF